MTLDVSMLFFIRQEELGVVMDRTHKCAVNGSPRVGGPEGPPAMQ